MQTLPSPYELCLHFTASDGDERRVSLREGDVQAIGVELPFAPFLRDARALYFPSQTLSLARCANASFKKGFRR